METPKHQEQLTDLLNRQDDQGRTFLYRAIKDHAKDVLSNGGMLRWLVTSEIKDKGFEEFANTLLIHVESGNFIKFLQCLIDEGVEVNGKYKPLGGGTPLHLMVQMAPGGGISLDIIKFWLENAKADVNATEDDGTTPLHQAGRLDNIDVMTILLEAGANVGGLSSYYMFTEGSSKGIFANLFPIPLDPKLQTLSLLINYGGIIDTQRAFNSYAKNIEEICNVSDSLGQHRSLYGVIQLLKASIFYEFPETVDKQKFFTHLNNYIQGIETTSWTPKISPAHPFEDFKEYESLIHILKCESATELFNTIKTKLQANLTQTAASSSISAEDSIITTDAFVQNEHQKSDLKTMGEAPDLSELV
ncbi:hypothetical protein phytr_4140 [Candidatus Phycorickettsia trachydisci]|uniref:Uncharacterized protein n=1 Tax=Candidatus Phycorickettsia trachydisci TaxID=2115978 RepID=A0A2P1P7Z9_9RICK|nr:ankyrin repeat domain-containing protein [Candidatus Phycorickettsia trachydisci]AVP87365.1 hypothetical protein phytr_4140 [Candidatus Phycorickettsia trachydisci]